jgi:uncharacterized membrane protein YdjX (TVP38/TMEM64 family)
MDYIKRHKHELEFLVLIIAILVIWYLGRYFRIDTQAIQDSLERLPIIYSGIIYIVLYVIVTFFVFFSKDVFWLTGAVLFGPLLSTLFICISETINAFILFYLSRSLGRAYVERQLSERYKKLDEKLAHINFFWLFIFRAAPLIPYRFLDLGAGLTRIHFRRYLAAVILGSPLKMFWIQYILFAVGKNTFNPYALTEYFLNNRALLIFSLIYVVLVIAVIFKMRLKE